MSNQMPETKPAQAGAHTPGLAPAPWSVDEASVGRSWTNSIAVVDAEGGEIAILTRGYEGDLAGDGCPSYANAHLIARAPDLLAENSRLRAANAELLAALEWMDRKGGLGLDVHERIRAAIANAKGLSRWARTKIDNHAARPLDERFPKRASNVQPVGAAPSTSSPPE